VPTEEVLSETVVFELPARTGGERLWERLRPRWSGGVYDGAESALLVVELRSEEGDLATLLRTVQFWAFEHGPDSLTFHLDGRAYVLESSAAIWPAAAA
jgi:hypothetical protein